MLTIACVRTCTRVKGLTSRRISGGKDNWAGEGRLRGRSWEDKSKAACRIGSHLSAHQRRRSPHSIVGSPPCPPRRFPAFKHGVAIRTSEPLNGCVFHLPDNPSLLPNAAGREEKRPRLRRRAFDAREATTKPSRGGGSAGGSTGETEENPALPRL